MIILCLVFWETDELFCRVTYHFIFPLAICEWSRLSVSLSALGVMCVCVSVCVWLDFCHPYFLFGHSALLPWNIVVSVWIFPMADDIEHLCLCPFAICLSLMWYLFMFFAHFSNWTIYFLLWVLRVTYVF